MGQLDGKTVVVTGGGHGIGRAYSERFGREGARVVVAELDEAAARDVADNIERAGGEALAAPTDVASWSSAQAMAERAVERFGGIDGLVNNAAIFSTIPIARVGFEQIDEGEWDRVMEVNVKGVWLCCRAVVPAMRRRGGGSIVNIASATVFNGTPIRVNAIAPGNTLSEENPSLEILRMREAAVAARSLKRVQRPDDIVGSVLFMLSDAAAFITGQTLLVDGGTALH